MMRLAHRCAVVLALCGLWLAGGCAAFWEDPSRAAQREREDALVAEERLRQLAGRIESLEMESVAVRKELERVRQQAETAGASRLRALEEQGAALDRRLRESEAAREKDRREIVDTLSQRMAELLQASASAAGRQTSAARRGNRSGWEHEVKSGESLSAIAAAYGVRVADIVQANQLRDEHRIRVGQKLFIPEP
jgi:nucleoid-associated protein YgaU